MVRIYDKYSVGPSIQPICTGCCFTMPIMTQVSHNFRCALALIKNTRPGEMRLTPELGRPHLPLLPGVHPCMPGLSQGGPIYPEAGLSIPRRDYLSRGGPIYPEAGLSIPRRAYLSRGRPIKQAGGRKGVIRKVVSDPRSENACRYRPLSSEYGTYKTVKARFWPCLPGPNRQHL